MTETVLICTPKSLPDHKLIEAADAAGRVNPLNRPRVPRRMQRPSPARLAAMTGKFWQAGQTLTWTFLDRADAATIQLMQAAYGRWAEYVNLTFKQTDDISTATFRWTRESGGYWSLIGTDCSQVPRNEPTGNLEGFNSRTRPEEWRRVADHEIGHGLGFGHTQLLPEIVNRIDPQKAIRYFGGPPNNWPVSVTKSNVLTPYRPGEVQLANVQLTSVMMYGLPASIMKDGIAIPGGSGITPEDGAIAAQIYPGKLPVKPPPKPGGPSKIEIGVPVKGRIDFATEVDQYAFDVVESARYSAETDPPMEIGLFKGEGTGKAIDHGYDENFPVARLKPGPYRVKVMHRFSKGTGDYTLMVSRVS